MKSKLREGRENCHLSDPAARMINGEGGLRMKRMRRVVGGALAAVMLVAAR